MQALALIGPPKFFTERLLQRLRDPCPRVRQMAAFAIGAMGDDGSEAIPTLATMLRDEDRSVQMHAMLALSRVAAVQK